MKELSKINWLAMFHTCNVMEVNTINKKGYDELEKFYEFKNALIRAFARDMKHHYINGAVFKYKASCNCLDWDDEIPYHKVDGIAEGLYYDKIIVDWGKGRFTILPPTVFDNPQDKSQEESLKILAGLVEFTNIYKGCGFIGYDTDDEDGDGIYSPSNSLSDLVINRKIHNHRLWMKKWDKINKAAG